MLDIYYLFSYLLLKISFSRVFSSVMYSIELNIFSLLSLFIIFGIFALFLNNILLLFYVLYMYVCSTLYHSFVDCALDTILVCTLFYQYYILFTSFILMRLISDMIAF